MSVRQLNATCKRVRACALLQIRWLCYGKVLLKPRTVVCCVHHAGSTISPCTKKRLVSSTLYPNHTLKQAVDYWRQSHQQEAED
jgi:hypothetical protein